MSVHTGCHVVLEQKLVVVREPWVIAVLTHQNVQAIFTSSDTDQNTLY